MSKSLDRFTLLETFIRIAESGSISAAARDLNLSQPSVSRQLVDLETRLNTQLIRRNTHSLSLTEAGGDLLSEARQITRGWQALEEKFLSAEQDINGNLKVVAPVALGQKHLARLACKFQGLYPKVNITWLLDDAAIRFTEMGCDCWIKVGSVPDETLIVRPLGHVERMLVGSSILIEHKSIVDMSIENGAIAPEQLGLTPMIALQPFEGNRVPLTNRSGETFHFSGNVAMTTNNIFALKEAALMGIGLAVLPRWFIEEELSSGQLIDVLPKWRAPTLTINIAYLPNRHQPARLKMFLQNMKTGVSQIPGIEALL